MKYSLANKEFKKRNAIFGQRKPTIQTEDHNLDCIKQMGSDMEDSSLIRINNCEEEPKVHVSYINREANYQLMHKEKNLQSYHRQAQNKFGRHNLVPNQKPLLPIIRTISSHSPSKVSFAQVPIKKLQIQSNVLSFEYFNNEKREQIAELKQLFLKLSYILLENNQRINQLQNIITTSQKCWKIFTQAINKSVALVYGLQGKIDLFLNTLRDVYENLRIGKLKQQNLQLYLKQSSKKQNTTVYASNLSNQRNKYISSPIKQNASQCFKKISSIKRQPNLLMNEKQKESEELLSLLEYQSDCSVVQSYPYKINQNQQFYPDKEIKKSEQQHSLKNIFNDQSPINMIKDFDPTFRPQKSQFQQFSPFQANKMMFHQSNKVTLNQKHYIESEQMKSATNNSPHRSSLMKSNWSYSFEQDKTKKITEWLAKRGEGKINCWLDEMGCLRRPNMTYCFWSNGDVIRLSQEEFNTLENQGVIKSINV